MPHTLPLFTVAILFLLAPHEPVSGEELTDAQKEAFLSNAEIQNTEKLKVGITDSRRANLSDGVSTHDAHIQGVNDYKYKFQGEGGRVEYDFRDSYTYNIAAYRLDRLVGFGKVPVSVEREVDGKPVAVTWWVDDVKMMEFERFKKKVAPRDTEDFNDQMYTIRIFNELIANTDPNLGNLLITTDWQLKPVDFTRAFRNNKGLLNPKNVVKVDRRVYDGLKALSFDSLQSELGEVLSKMALRSILARRDKIIHVLDKRIKSEGRGRVICEKQGH